MDFVSQAVPMSGGKYSISVDAGAGVGSVLSEEQLIQKSEKTSKSVDLDMVAIVGLEYDQKYRK
jgi:hypothetical protein